MGSNFDENLYEWIDASLSTDYPGLAIIRAEQNGPRPNPPYVTYKALIWNDDTHPTWEKSEVDEDFFQTDFENRVNVQVSINAYSPEGREMLTRLKDSKKSWPVRRLLENNNMSLLPPGEIQDLSRLGDTKFVKRFFRSFNFLTSTEYVVIEERVHSVTVDGIIKKDEV